MNSEELLLLFACLCQHNFTRTQSIVFKHRELKEKCAFCWSSLSFLSTTWKFKKKIGWNEKRTHQDINPAHKSLRQLQFSVGREPGAEVACNKMADQPSRLSCWSYTHICVVHGTVSLPGQGDEAGCLQLWYNEKSNVYRIYACSKTERSVKWVCEFNIDVLLFQCQECTDKIKTLSTKKSKYLKQRSLKTNGTMSWGSRVRTKFYESIIDSGSERVFLIFKIIQTISINNRPIANMATISPKRGFSVATVAKGWLLCLPVPLLERLQLLRRLFL